MKKYKILALDQSLDDTGICILTNKGYEVSSIKTKPDNKLFGDVKRLIYIRDEIKKIIQNNKDIDIIFMEGFSFNSKGQKLFTIAGLGFFIREILYNAYKRKVKIVFPSPHQLKLFAIGSCPKGVKKDKGLIRMKILSKWNEEIYNNNHADAFVLAKMGEAYLNENLISLDYEKKIIKDLKRVFK